jgi:hypothetical protein
LTIYRFDKDLVDNSQKPIETLVKVESLSEVERINTHHFIGWGVNWQVVGSQATKRVTRLLEGDARVLIRQESREVIPAFSAPV